MFEREYLNGRRHNGIIYDYYYNKNEIKEGKGKVRLSSYVNDNRIYEG